MQRDAQRDDREESLSLAVLEQHRIDSVKDGKFLEAEAARVRIQGMVEAENMNQKETLRSKHAEDKLSIEESQTNELDTFNEIWDQKRTEYEAHAGQLQKVLEDRGVDEHVQYME